LHLNHCKVMNVDVNNFILLVGCQKQKFILNFSLTNHHIQNNAEKCYIFWTFCYYIIFIILFLKLILELYIFGSSHAPLTKTQNINFIFTIKDIAKNLFIGNVHIFYWITANSLYSNDVYFHRSLMPLNAYVFIHY
jgi:hypothetical protein